MSSFPNFCLWFIFSFQYKINKMSRRTCIVSGLLLPYPHPSWSPLQSGTIWWWLSTPVITHWWEWLQVCSDWTSGKHRWLQEIPGSNMPVFRVHFGNNELGDYWVSRIQTPPPPWVSSYFSAWLPPLYLSPLPFPNLRR